MDGQTTRLANVSLIALSQLFHSLSKVLFTFPSRYLWAIGHGSIFSFRWHLPPNLRSNTKLRDSTSVPHKREFNREPHTGLSPSVKCLSRQLKSFGSQARKTTSLVHNSGQGGSQARFTLWALPSSLAVTGGILVSFFSSAE